jgi:prepilin-type N-terminal cleavage/methylation domain-containing protein
VRDESVKQRKKAAGFTMTELMVATALGSLVLTVVAVLSVYSTRSFVALGNYADLDAHSRKTLDVLSRELRQATAVVAIQTNLSPRSLTLTNADAGYRIKMSWDAQTRALVLEKTGQGPRTLLTECDKWEFALYNRAPTVSSSNISFTTAATLAECKLIDISWKCSRRILGNKINTESVQGAQIVLRNKIN